MWYPGSGVVLGCAVSLSLASSLLSMIFIPNFLCVLTVNNLKLIKWIFHSVTSVMPQGLDLGIKHSSVGIYDGVLLTVHSSYS